MTNIKLSYVSSINDNLADELEKHTNTGSSGFRWWLDVYRPYTVAMVVYSEDVVIGWAAARLGPDTISYFEIGVFIDQRFRRRGIATMAFDALLLQLKKENKNNVAMDFDRHTCMTRLMSNHLDSFGFTKLGESCQSQEAAW